MTSQVSRILWLLWFQDWAFILCTYRKRSNQSRRALFPFIYVRQDPDINLLAAIRGHSDRLWTPYWRTSFMRGFLSPHVSHLPTAHYKQANKVIRILSDQVIWPELTCSAANGPGCAAAVHVLWIIYDTYVGFQVTMRDTDVPSIAVFPRVHVILQNMKGSVNCCGVKMSMNSVATGGVVFAVDGIINEFLLFLLSYVLLV